MTDRLSSIPDVETAEDEEAEADAHTINIHQQKEAGLEGEKLKDITQIGIGIREISLANNPGELMKAERHELRLEQILAEKAARRRARSERRHRRELVKAEKRELRREREERHRIRAELLEEEAGRRAAEAERQAEEDRRLQIQTSQAADRHQRNVTVGMETAAAKKSESERHSDWSKRRQRRHQRHHDDQEMERLKNEYQYELKRIELQRVGAEAKIDSSEGKTVHLKNTPNIHQQNAPHHFRQTTSLTTAERMRQILEIEKQKKAADQVPESEQQQQQPLQTQQPLHLSTTSNASSICASSNDNDGNNSGRQVIEIDLVTIASQFPSTTTAGGGETLRLPTDYATSSSDGVGRTVEDRNGQKPAMDTLSAILSENGGSKADDWNSPKSLHYYDHYGTSSAAENDVTDVPAEGDDNEPRKLPEREPSYFMVHYQKSAIIKLINTPVSTVMIPQQLPTRKALEEDEENDSSTTTTSTSSAVDREIDQDHIAKIESGEMGDLTEPPIENAPFNTSSPTAIFAPTLIQMGTRSRKMFRISEALEKAESSDSLRTNQSDIVIQSNLPLKHD